MSMFFILIFKDIVLIIVNGLVLFFNTDTKSKLNIAIIYEASLFL
jgi:hypothetical protein